MVDRAGEKSRDIYPKRRSDANQGPEEDRKASERHEDVRQVCFVAALPHNAQGPQQPGRGATRLGGCDDPHAKVERQDRSVDSAVGES